MRTDCIDHGCKGYGLGYATAWVYKDGVKLPTTKHRRVHYEATGEWPIVVRHKCDNPRCINPEHLEGGDYVDNMRDCKERGRLVSKGSPGVANGRAKLNDSLVRYIRQMYIKGDSDWGLSAISRRLGMGVSTLHRIITGQAWQHVV